MTNQEAFDKVVQRFFVEMHGPSVNDGGFARYHGPAGERCAIGCIVPDEDYDPAWEGKPIWVAPGLRAWIEKQGLDLLLMGRLQSSHDNFSYARLPSFRSKMATSLMEAARCFTGPGSISTEKLLAAYRPVAKESF